MAQPRPLVDVRGAVVADGGARRCERARAASLLAAFVAAGEAPAAVARSAVDRHVGHGAAM